MVQAVDLFILSAGFLPFFLGCQPILAGDDGLMDALIDRVIFLLGHMILVAGALDLFVFPAAVGQLSGVTN